MNHNYAKHRINPKATFIYNKFAFLYSILLIISVLSNSVSSHTVVILIGKVTVSVLLCSLFFIDRIKFKHFFVFNKDLIYDKNFLLMFFLLVIPPFFSLFYSHNIQFGLIKLSELLLGILPLIICSYLFLRSSNFNWEMLYYASLIVAIFIILTIILTNPFTFGSRKLLHFSHVISGRFLSFVTVVQLYLTTKNFNKKNLVLLFSLAIGTALTFHRASILGVIIFGAILVFYNIKKGKERKIKGLTTFLAVILLFAVVILSSQKFKPEGFSRIENLVEMNVDRDGPALARLEAVKLSLEIIKSHPIIGVGFGGFNSDFENNKIQKLIKYPHNIILEYLVETGLIGFLFFLILFVKIILALKKNLLSLILFLFSFWLALFSKDISTQAFLWVFIAVGEISNVKFRKTK